MGKLDGKVAIVTGASRGIGAWISQLFAAEGARVVCVARTLKEGDHILEGSLEMTCAQIRESGGEATPVAANISLPEDCERLIEETKSAYGPADVLVNNAALTYFIPIKDYPLNRWMRTWSVNIHAPFLLSQLVLPEHDQQEERQHSQHFIHAPPLARAEARTMKNPGRTSGTPAMAPRRRLLSGSPRAWPLRSSSMGFP